MKQRLKKQKSVVYYYANGKRVEGVHSLISGDVSGIIGNTTGTYGDVSGIYGDVSGIYGNMTGTYGDVSGIGGDVDSCEISQDEREKGIDIETLIEN